MTLAEAFPFVFKAQLAMPDMEGQGDQEGRKREVEVELAEFTELMGHRCEHQFGGDWCFSYVRWNYLFRQQMHRARGLSLRRLAGSEEGDEGNLCGEEVKKAACEISEGLSGKYLGTDGQLRPVGGDGLCAWNVKRCIAAAAGGKAYNGKVAWNNRCEDVDAIPSQSNASGIWGADFCDHEPSREAQLFDASFGEMVQGRPRGAERCRCAESGGPNAARATGSKHMAGV